MISGNSRDDEEDVGDQRSDTPSVAPPTYAAVTPMIAEIAVAASPAPNAMTIDCRVPQTTWAKMSWP